MSATLSSAPSSVGAGSANCEELPEPLGRAALGAVGVSAGDDVAVAVDAVVADRKGQKRRVVPSITDHVVTSGGRGARKRQPT
jgi:hypothetical protein